MEKPADISIGSGHPLRMPSPEVLSSIPAITTRLLGAPPAVNACGNASADRCNHVIFSAVWRSIKLPVNKFSGNLININIRIHFTHNAESLSISKNCRSIRLITLGSKLGRHGNAAVLSIRRPGKYRIHSATQRAPWSLGRDLQSALYRAGCFIKILVEALAASVLPLPISTASLAADEIDAHGAQIAGGSVFVLYARRSAPRLIRQTCSAIGELRADRPMSSVLL